MRTAFLLLNMVLDYNKLYVEELWTRPEVKYAYNVHGAYDVVVKVECDSMEAVKDFIVKEIRTNPDLKSSLTMLVVTGFTVAR
ncbi:hypothetical protein LCGC14_2158810 [marine sediment metagenome]|uniref:Transcription regulator AsnC/Lrp ligand binding domain-containing protein n=1 Tax=marine sediment metagenome TaxID=412755 RepID=A0A0F9GPG1_9ZZZZ